MNKVVLLTGCLAAAGLFQTATAGSAVAWPGHGRFFYSSGYPREIAEKRALQLCYSEYGSEARIVASTDRVGYGAIAVARRGNESVAGISLGRPTQADADARAIDKCVRAGGTNPKVRSSFKG
jgi:hypothetical protein